MLMKKTLEYSSEDTKSETKLLKSEKKKIEQVEFDLIILSKMAEFSEKSFKKSLNHELTGLSGKKTHLAHFLRNLTIAMKGWSKKNVDTILQYTKNRFLPASIADEL